MKISTICAPLSMLIAGALSSPCLAQESEEFTPTAEITAGWYQAKMTKSGTSAGTTAINAGNNWVQVTNTEYTKIATSTTGAGSYLLKLSSKPEHEATTFLYITPSSSTTGSYDIQTINGHYLASRCVASTTATSAITLTAGSSTDYNIKAGSLYLDYYASGQAEAPHLGGYGNSGYANTRYQLSKVTDIDTKYDVYTVTITGGTLQDASSMYAAFNATVTCSNAANKGISTVYNNGKFFFPKGTTIQQSDFSATQISNAPYTITIDSDKKTISVVYTSNTVPDLNEGDIVVFRNVRYDGQYYRLYMDETNGLKVSTSDTDMGLRDKFMVKKLGNQYVFVSLSSGYYMSYPASGSTTSGKVDAINKDFSAFNFASGSTKIAGSFVVYTNKRAANNNTKGSIVVNTDGSYDGYTEAVGFKSSYSNLYLIDKVSLDYTFKKVNLQQKDGKNYASLYLPYSYQLPESIDAYYGKSLNSENTAITLKKIESIIIPRNTPVILMSENVSGEQTLEPIVNTTAPTAIEDNILKGKVETTAVASGSTIYGFTGKYDEVGFYKWTGENVPLGKAYIETSNSSSAQGLSINFDATTTGIQAIGVDSSNQAKAAYDLSGRRVANPTKGVYIINGKKVVLR